jgi:target of rapamycin complex subunit LST8
MFQNHESTTLQPCRVFKAHKDYLTRLLLSPDVKNLATCSADHTVRIWKIDPTEEYLEHLPDLEKSDSAVSKSTGSTASFDTNPQINGSMNLKKTDSRILNGSMRGSNGFSDGADSFRRSDIDVITQRKPLPSDIVLENHQRWVWDCAFSADSAYLVTVCSDHYARLWELQTAQIIRQYNGHHRGAVCVALNDYSEPR